MHLFQSEYPKFLRFFEEMISRINVLLGTNNEEKRIRDSVLKNLESFKNAYLAKSLSQLLDPINEMFKVGRPTYNIRGFLSNDVDKIIRVVNRLFIFIIVNSNVLDLTMYF